MKLKTKFLLFSLLIHAVFVYLLIELYHQNRTLFLIGEGLVLLSIGFTIWLYRSISHPFDIISSGIESLKDKDFSSKLNRVGHQEMDELISVYNMMIDQLREERLLQVEKSSFLGKLIQASPTGIIILDFDGNVESLNPSAVELSCFQLNDVKGKNLRSIPGKLAEELSSLEIGESRIVNLSGMQSYKCQKSSFVDKGFTRAFITIEELTKEIYAREKNAYERVIKMMSHEVNNSIGAINSILNSCLNYKEQLVEDDREDYQNALQVSIERNRNLSVLMSNFARVIRIPEPVKQPADLIQMLRSVQVLMEPEARKKEIEWIWLLEETSLDTVIDYQQMEQVLINIMKNAIEAVDVKGEIEIKASSNPKYVSISNTGPGISKEIAEQIFSPFFSTKKNGQGIGLMLTREILINHGFKFSLQSKDGKTEFRVEL